MRKIATHAVATSLLLVLLGLMGGCRRQAGTVANSNDKSTQSARTPANNGSKPAQQVRTAASNDIMYLLPGKLIQAVFTTTSRSLVIQAAEDLVGAYVWEPGQEPKLLVQGKSLGIRRLSDDSFAAWYSNNDDQTSVVTFNAHQLTSQPLGLPKSTGGWRACAGHDQVFVCTGNRPGMKPEEVDERGFTTVLVVDLAERKTSRFEVGHRTDYRFDAARNLIYVSDQFTRPRAVEIFNLKGESLGPTDESHLQATSPSGRFIESLAADGGIEWQIYEVATRQELFAFNCAGSGCKVGDHDGDYWNPVIDGQFVVVEESRKPGGKGSTCDVYQASPPHLVKKFLCDGMPAYDWSRDGKELITLEEDGGSYHRETVN